MTSSFDEFRDHIELAEQAGDMVDAWIEKEEVDDPQLHPPGPVADAVVAMVRLFVTEDSADFGDPISQKSLDRQTGRLRDAVAGLSLFPTDVRMCIAAPLAELAEFLSFGWLIPEVLDTLRTPIDPSDSEEPDAVQSAMDRLLASTIRMMIATDEWSEDFESILETYRDVCRSSSGDGRLMATLSRAILFHAWSGRQALVARNRQKHVDDEPLPSALARALDRMTKGLELSPMVPQCLHLALVDAQRAGLIPQRSKPLVTVASMFLAWAFFDTAGMGDEVRDDNVPDVRELARWARSRPMEILEMSRQLTAVFDRRPLEDLDPETTERYLERYLFVGYPLEAMPCRWIPDQVPPRPASVGDLATHRLEKLRDVAWMMVDPLEPVRFVLEALPDTDEFDDRIDAVFAEALGIWNDEKYVDVRDLDDDDGDDEVGGDAAWPHLTTTEGETLLFCRRRYRFDTGDLETIAARLDDIPGAERHDGDPFSWVFLGGREGDLVLGTAFTNDDILTIETMSGERDRRLGTLLEDALGDLVELFDRDSREPRPGLAPSDPDVDAADPPRRSGFDRATALALMGYYGSWLDTPLSALDEKTPREAARDETLRPSVVRLLREINVAESHGPGVAAHLDLGFLWSELGLDPDE
jgi:hypothetical protein